MAKRPATSFSGRNAYGYLKHLAADIGPRLIGSPGEHKAARYIEKTFRSFGLETRRQKYPCTTYGSERCVFEVLDKGKWCAIQCEPVMLSKSTPRGGIEANIFFLEAGEPECFTPEMKGRIVLLCGSLRPQDRPLFLSHKPRALIFVEGGISKESPRTMLRDARTYGNLPMARILHLDGLDVVKRGLTRARFTMRNVQKKSHSFNVIGEKTGDAFPDEIIVICAHYDSHMNTSGAGDNAAGTAVMMELARILSKKPTRRTLRFIAFSGEESGLKGSIHYADQLGKKTEREKKRKSFNDKADKTELDRHRFTLNLDVHGFVFGHTGATFSGVDDIGAALRLLAKEFGRACQAGKGPFPSDGTPLAALGIPALQFGRGGHAPGHTSLDDIRHISPKGLAETGELAELYLRRYVTRAAAFPFPREIDDEQMKAIKEWFKRTKWRIPGEKDKES